MVLRKIKFILLGFFFGILVWFVESLLHTFIFQTEEIFLRALFFPDIHELWMRSLFSSFPIFLGFYTQIVSNRKLKESDKKFQKSEAKYYSFVENFDGIAFQGYNDFSIGFMDGAVEQITGYKAEEFASGRIKWDQIIHTDDKVRIYRAVEKFHSNSAKSDEREYQIIHKKGELRWVLEKIQKIYDDSGREISVQGTIHDITERKKAKKVIRETEYKYKSLFDNMLEGFALCKIITDENDKPIDFEYLEVNDAFERLTGLKKEETEGHRVSEIIPGIKGSEPNLFKIYGKVALTGETTKFEIFFEPLEIWLSISVYSPKKGYFVAVFDNITERKIAEEKLKESEKRLHLIFDGSHDLITITDENAKPFWVNSAWESIFGPLSEYEDDPLQLIHPEDIEKVGIAWNALITTEKQIKDCEYRYRMANGEFRTFETSAFVIILENERKYCVIAHDITERKVAEEKLKESKQKYQDMIENLDVGFYKGVINGELLVHNRTLNRILGLNPSVNLIGADASKFFVNKEDQNRYHKQLIDNGFINNFIAKIKKPNGEQIIVELNSHIIKRTKGEPIIVEGIVHDITEKFKLEQKVEERTNELKKSEEKTRNIIDNISDVLTEANSKGEITYISHQIFDLIGYKPDEIIGLNFVKLIHLDDIKFYKESLKKAQDSKEPITIECRIKHKKGYYIPISAKGTKVEIDNKIKIFGVIRDISERKRLDDMIKKEIKKLREIDLIKSDLVRRISHELNTPLISIFSGAQYLLNYYSEELSDNVQSIIKIIYSGGNRLKDMVDNLIIAYDIESNIVILDLKRENIIPIIKNCIDTIILDAEKRNLSIKVELLDELYLDIDKLNISRAIINILSNAVKNTPPNGNIYVKTSKHRNYVDIIIQDTGVGLTKKEIPLLFRKFGKIERYGKGLDVDIEGPGLGLYISKEIIKLHNGEIRVKSKGRNKGTRFVIRFFLTNNFLKLPTSNLIGFQN